MVRTWKLLELNSTIAKYYVARSTKLLINRTGMKWTKTQHRQTGTEVMNTDMIVIGNDCNENSIFFSSIIEVEFIVLPVQTVFIGPESILSLFFNSHQPEVGLTLIRQVLGCRFYFFFSMSNDPFVQGSKNQEKFPFPKLSLKFLRLFTCSGHVPGKNWQKGFIRFR